MNNDQRFSTLFPVVMILATAMPGWISLKDGVSPRVAHNRASAPVPADEPDVVARLWEDPLQAVQSKTAKMQQRIEEERRGAYARFIQDPALLAMLLPSGIFGVLNILFGVLFAGT